MPSQRLASGLTRSRPSRPRRRRRRRSGNSGSRRWFAEYVAARRAAGIPGDVSRSIEQDAIDAGFTPSEAVALEGSIAEILRTSEPIGRAIAPPYGTMWQVALARSARLATHTRPPRTSEVVAVALLAASVLPRQPRALPEILSGPIGAGTETVKAGLRRVREHARALVRTSLPRMPADEALRYADGLVFGMSSTGLSSEELDVILGEGVGREPHRRRCGLPTCHRRCVPPRRLWSCRQPHEAGRLGAP